MFALITPGRNTYVEKFTGENELAPAISTANGALEFSVTITLHLIPCARLFSSLKNEREKYGAAVDLKDAHTSTQQRATRDSKRHTECQ
jgi:hypothetical protein